MKKALYNIELNSILVNTIWRSGIFFWIENLYLCQIRYEIVVFVKIFAGKGKTNNENADYTSTNNGVEQNKSTELLKDCEVNISNSSNNYTTTNDGVITIPQMSFGEPIKFEIKLGFDDCNANDISEIGLYFPEK